VTPLEQSISWVLDNRSKIQRYGYIPRGLVGVLFLVLGCLMGKAHFQLLLSGTGTTGTIVGYKAQEFSKFSRSTARGAPGSGLRSIGYMPIVEFDVDIHSFQFQDWLGANSTPTKGTRVKVLYDETDPSKAMIDRSVMNWIPWGPMAAVGLFLVLVALKGWLATRPL
jgi:hypothetical protein